MQTTWKSDSYFCYVFKMAANGGRHFEINIKTENYKTQFITQKHAFTKIFDKWAASWQNQHTDAICPVWSESSLCAQCVAKDPSFLHADSKDSDQTRTDAQADLSLLWAHMPLC